MKRVWSHTLQIGNARREVEGKFKGDEYSRDYFDICVNDRQGNTRSLSRYPERIRDVILVKIDQEVRL